MTGGRRVVLGSICWVLGLEYFAGQAIAQGAWKTPYSLVTNGVSDLGATSCGWLTILGSSRGYVCSPLQGVYNTSCVLFGLLTLAGAILTWQVWPRRRLTTWGLVSLCVLGLGRVVAGLNPEDVRIALHAVGALPSMLCGVLGMLFLGAAVWPARRGLGALSVVLGAGGLVLFLLLETVHYGPLGPGGEQRLVLEPVVAWMAGVGIWFLVSYRERRYVAFSLRAPG